MRLRSHVISQHDNEVEFAVEGHSIPHELQTILGNLSEESHRPRKKYNSFSLKNVKILIPTPTFLQCVHTFDV